MHPVSDPSVAGWITEAIHPFAQDVGSVIPEGFDAYLRVLHPAGMDHGVNWRPVRWRDIATANGKEFHPEMQFEFLVPDDCFGQAKNWRHGQEGLWEWPPSDGDIPDDVAAMLADVLGGFTGIPEHCYFAYWEGWGDPVDLVPTRVGEKAPEPEPRDYAGTPRGERAGAAHFTIPGRGYYLFEGPIVDVTTDWTSDDPGHFPSMWWPADRSWCVASEIDFDTTYVGGPAGITEAILGHPGLEAVRTLSSHGIGLASDRINGPK